ncbi:hypothetical protein [Burkholderia gladioli]|uniref:hypothetical protein n=1 Tax=Burkholderia gladioli TaxID=28095 RepID=UPI003B980AD3
MERFTTAVREAIAQRNWYSSLAMALTLPDVCANLETPDQGSRARYVRWFEEWVQDKYTSHFGLDRTIFLSGNDCYALRCSYLHEGAGDIQGQRAREALDRFHFITPPPGGSIVHNNRINAALQLQVDIFANDIADSVDAWSSSVKENPDIQTRIGSLLIIHNSDHGIRF